MQPDYRKVMTEEEYQEIMTRWLIQDIENSAELRAALREIIREP